MRVCGVSRIGESQLIWRRETMREASQSSACSGKSRIQPTLRGNTRSTPYRRIAISAAPLPREARQEDKCTCSSYFVQATKKRLACFPTNDAAGIAGEKGGGGPRCLPTVWSNNRFVARFLRVTSSTRFVITKSHPMPVDACSHATVDLAWLAVMLLYPCWASLARCVRRST